MPRLLLAVLLPVVVQGAAAQQSDCTATARYPDGSVVERECIVEGQPGARKAWSEKAARKRGISEEMAWMKDTRWLWNEWREVRKRRPLAARRRRLAARGRRPSARRRRLAARAPRGEA